MTGNVEIDATLLVNELSAQRNALADQLAVAGARIVALQNTLASQEKLTKDLQEKLDAAISHEVEKVQP